MRYRAHIVSPAKEVPHAVIDVGVNGPVDGQAAGYLPGQSTTLWAEPSSTGDRRLRGAPKRTQFSGWRRSIRPLLSTQGGRITMSSRDVATR